jgi:serine/threonine protein kinase
MTPDPKDPPDEGFNELLAAYEEALAARQPAPDGDAAPAERLAQAQAVLRRLEHDRRRRARWCAAASPPPVTEGLAFDANGNPTQIDRFQIVRELGRGGTGTVFLAHDPRLSRTVALKLPWPEVWASPLLRHRFLREGRTAAGFDHPNLVPVYEAGEIGPLCYIVSAYCRGPSLRDWLEQHPGPVEPRAAAALLATLAEAVGYCHDRGILHRDLKPGNVLLTPPEQHNPKSGIRNPKAESSPKDKGSVPEPSEPRAPEHPPLDCGNPGASPPLESELKISEFIAKLTDFGLAKYLESDDGQTRSGTVLGTPRYMAPEQSEGRIRDMGPHTDVYALGVILYEVLTGQIPAWEAGEAGPALVPPRRWQPAVPRDLDAACRRCLEREPGERFPTANELAAALRKCLESHPGGGWLTAGWRRLRARLGRGATGNHA